MHSKTPKLQLHALSLALRGALFLFFLALLSPSVSAWVVPLSGARGAQSISVRQVTSLSACKKRRKKRRADIYTPDPNSLRGRTIVITGASSGLGLESAKRLGTAGANLVLTARTSEKGEDAVEMVESYLKGKGVYYDNQTVAFKVLDFDNITSIKERVKNDWDDVETIDVLLNNAGIMALPERQISVDRIEKQMQSNHLGPFVFTSMLVEKLSTNARIINVSSEAHKIAMMGLDFEYMWKALLGYNPWISYGQSKLANILFTQELQRRADAAGRTWTVATLHPGGVATNLGRSLVSGERGSILNSVAKILSRVALKTPEEGASTQIWLATGSPGEADVRGKYFDNRKAQPLSLVATDRLSAERLWKESEEIGGVKFKL